MAMPSTEATDGLSLAIQTVHQL